MHIFSNFHYGPKGMHLERVDCIEPTSFYEKDAQVLWTRWYDDAPDDPNIRKKYTFRSHIHAKLPNTLH